jgi:3'-phosphoadenosine 5'-phosphosulfate sulfotransferase (PAPS reductase)/FAD synthetase
MDERSALLYAKLHNYTRLVNRTHGFIRWALARVQTPYVACSFGKDSAVMLHMVLEQAPDIPVRFIRWKNETEHIDNYDEVIAQWGRLNLAQVELARLSLSVKSKDRYHTTGYDSYFIGLRASESTHRRMTLTQHGMFYKNKAEMIRISPLADWKDPDIAAYIFSNKLPLLNTYKSDGITSRTASRIPRADYGIRESFIQSLKQRDINAYQELLKNFPEIKQYE